MLRSVKPTIISPIEKAAYGKGWGSEREGQSQSLEQRLGDRTQWIAARPPYATTPLVAATPEVLASKLRCWVCPECDLTQRVVSVLSQPVSCHFCEAAGPSRSVSPVPMHPYNSTTRPEAPTPSAPHPTQHLPQGRTYTSIFPRVNIPSSRIRCATHCHLSCAGANPFFGEPGAPNAPQRAAMLRAAEESNSVSLRCVVFLEKAQRTHIQVQSPVV